MLSSNMRKLKGAYRHPFEYINPRLYQKRDYKATGEATANASFFVENEEEFQALQEKADNSSQSRSAEA